MSECNNKIIWEKWIDPYLGDIDNVGEEWEQSAEDEEEEYVEDNEEYAAEAEIVKHKMFALSSPMGFIPYDEYSIPGKIFNFWTGHTDFTITQSVSDAIESTEGVEILDVFTRYRFRIAIGKAFQDRLVMNNIDLNIKKLFNE